MKKQLKEINVGMLLKEIDTATETNIIEASKLKGKRTKAEYEVLFCDANDFAIRKSGTRTNKLLVSIYSKKLLYFYDTLTNEMEKVLKVEQLIGFFNDVKADEIIIPKGTVKYLKDQSITKNRLDEWFDFVTSNNGVRMFVLSGLCYYPERSYGNIFIEIGEYYDTDKNVMKYIISNSEHSYSYEQLIGLLRFAYGILKLSDLSTAKYFFDKWKLSSIALNYKNLELFKTFNLNTRRFIDYILFDLYKQGANPNILTTYEDYLKMSVSFYGTVKEKYPKNLLTEHQIISSKENEKKRIAESSAEFENTMNACENFNFSTSTDQFVIIMPKVSTELVDEGQTLNHCVASYVNKVVSNDCIVVFMRLKEEKEMPYLTIEILPDRSVSQVEGMNKRSELTKEEIDFIMKWAKARSLKVTAENVIRK